jgi:hypothetical protein
VPIPEGLSEVSEPERLDQFIAVLDALYARREVLAARLDYLTLATTAAERTAPEQDEIESIEAEYAQIDETDCCSQRETRQ